MALKLQRAAAGALMLAAILTLPAHAGAVGLSGEDVVELNPAATTIEFTLPGSLHATHGTFRLSSGVIRVDPSTGKARGKLIVDAASGDTGNGLRDGVMRGRVLDATSYPEIIFTPRTVEGRRGPGGAFTGTISGTIRLQGAEREVSFEVHGLLSGDRITGTTHFVIPYTQWGLSDPSFLFFRVADKVEVDVSTAGHITWSTAYEDARDQSAIGSRPPLSQPAAH